MSTTFFASRNSIDTYKQCKYRFYLRYCEKDKGFTDSDDKSAAIFGNVIHKVEEFYHKNPKLNIMEVYKEEFKNADITDQELFDVGYSLVEDYTISAKSGRKVLGVELPFELYLANGVPVKGFIDRIDEISDDEIEIIDYKTGKFSLSENDLRRDIQLGLYELVVRLLFPQYKKVKLTLNYLRYDKVSIYKTDEERQKLEAYLAVMYDKISDSLSNPTKETMPAKVNTFCSFCEFKSKCPEFQGVIKSTSIDPEEFKGLISRTDDLVINEEQINDFISTVKGKIKILTDLKEQATDYVKEYIKSTGKESASVGGKTFYLAKKKYTKYDVNTVIAVLKDKVDLNTVLEPVKSRIDSVVAKDKDAMEELQKTSKVEYSNSYVK